MTVKSNCELDVRIKSTDDIQTCLRYNEGFVGCKGYFFDDLVKVTDLSKSAYGTLLKVDNTDHVTDLCFKAELKNGNRSFFRFFIPEKLLKPVKKKYRPFTGIEFAEKFNLKLNSIITLRSVPTNDHPCYNYKVVFTGYRWYDDVFQVFLNGHWLDLPELLELYEYEENGEWHKFGVEE